MTTATPPTTTQATPLMQQYMGIKMRYPDEIVFFRLGDFYEMFYGDALKAAPILEVVLTKRQNIPMCGVPYHAATNYMSKLLKAGLSVAMAEQLEDPKKTKGMVKRDVVRIVTPGTILEQELLPSKANNFLVAISLQSGSKSPLSSWALVAADISTGRQWAGEFKNDLHFAALKSQLAGLAPSEVLLIGEASKLLNQSLMLKAVVRFEPVPAESKNLVDQSVKAIQSYLKRDRENAIVALQEPEILPMESSGTLFLDETAIRHLELIDSADPFRSGPTLLAILDQCVTALGSRLLRWWLLHPSTELSVINRRLDQVEGLYGNSILRDELRESLRDVSDLERISVRVQAGTASPRDLGGLRQTLQKFPSIQDQFSKASQEIEIDVFRGQLENLNVPAELLGLLENQLADELPSKLDDGNVIRDGVHPELDELRSLRKKGRTWIAEMEAEEKAKTGITTLKVGYTDVFGYYLEVSKSHIPKVPTTWIRKQTLTNAERYITPELKAQEEKILGAEEKILTLERQLFQELVSTIAAFGPTLMKMSSAIAELDAVSSLAQVGSEQGYIRPSLTNEDALTIQGGRHPVIEKQIGRDRFIPNNITFDKDKRVMVITGPNMAGKSTYLRQAALIVIMAQMGSFVPATEATIGVVDRIFTRIGASDRLSQGQSTFMVEMQEVATLLHNSTGKSLLVLDEVGRGTSTYDGVSIAWAVIDHLVRRSKNSVGPRTLFATHYFELTDLSEQLPGVVNAHATAKEWPTADGGRQVVFLYQIAPGPADKSYGIHVAEMAGLPQECIKRAREILKQLESGTHHLTSKRSEPKSVPVSQLEFFQNHPLLEELQNLEVDKMTPMEAIITLADLKERARRS